MAYAGSDIASAGQLGQPRRRFLTKVSHRSLRSPLTLPAHTAAASALAGSLVRDIVAALGALIVLVIVLLLIMSSRRRRALAGTGEGPGRPQSHRGQHGHRRTDQQPRSAQPLRAVQHPGSAQETTRSTRPQLSTPAPAPAVSWPAPGGWQGGSVGEIAQPPAAPARPVITPVARPTAASRSGAGMPSGPPWAPAAEPENTFGPLPVASAISFRPQPGGGLRVPPDVTGPPGSGVFDPPVLPSSADSSAWPPLFDYTAPSPPDLGADLSQRGLGFAAAPVAAGWDLAATDVFPAVPSEPSADTDPDDDAPGASGR
jgi:hypothetical protein